MLSSSDVLWLWWCWLLCCCWISAHSPCGSGSHPFRLMKLLHGRGQLDSCLEEEVAAPLSFKRLCSRWGKDSEGLCALFQVATQLHGRSCRFMGIMAHGNPRPPLPPLPYRGGAVSWKRDPALCLWWVCTFYRVSTLQGSAPERWVDEKRQQRPGSIISHDSSKFACMQKLPPSLTNCWWEKKII